MYIDLKQQLRTGHIEENHINIYKWFVSTEKGLWSMEAKIEELSICFLSCNRTKLDRNIVIKSSSCCILGLISVPNTDQDFRCVCKLVRWVKWEGKLAPMPWSIRIWELVLTQVAIHSGSYLRMVCQTNGTLKGHSNFFS